MTLSAARLRADESIIGVSTRSLRDGILEAREQLTDDLDDDRWHDLGMHDFRRTWATDTFYSLAFESVPIAEELTMAWGGWVITDSGRETFHRNYLGPVPDQVTSKAIAIFHWDSLLVGRFSTNVKVTQSAQTRNWKAQ